MRWMKLEAGLMDHSTAMPIAGRTNAPTRGIDAVLHNANDGISLAKAAEGALATIAYALQRMRILALRAQDGSHGGAELAILDAQYQWLSAEITRIAAQTKFNSTDRSGPDLRLRPGPDRQVPTVHSPSPWISI